MGFALLIIFLLILILVIIAITVSLKDKRGDYSDGGGRQVGGAGRSSIFTPQNERAGLYRYKTRYFNRQVKNNIDRFPDDFMFQLNREEWNSILK